MELADLDPRVRRFAAAGLAGADGLGPVTVGIGAREGLEGAGEVAATGEAGPGRDGLDRQVREGGEPACCA